MKSPTLDELSQDGWGPRDLPGHMGNCGPLWTRKVDGIWNYGLLAAEKHLNPAGMVHGGVLLTVLDHVISTVAWEATGRRPCVTVQLDAQFLSAVRPGNFVVVSAAVVRQSRELLFMRGQACVDSAAAACAQAIVKVVGGAPGDGH